MYVDGSDAMSEGDWQFTVYGAEGVPYINWGVDEPDAGAENCLAKWVGGNVYFDMICYITISPVNVLCEVDSALN